MVMEKLPQPDVIIPAEAETLRLMLDDQRLEWLGSLASEGRGSYDGQRNARQAKANLNHLLDHWPNGTPRDHLVMYPHITTPDNILVGQD